MPESVYALALLRAERDSDPVAARRAVVQKAADLGYPPAQFALAEVLHRKGADEDRAAAREFLERAAGQGHAEAAAELALLLDTDRRDGDVAKIVSLLTRASDAGSARADYALGQRSCPPKDSGGERGGAAR